MAEARIKGRVLMLVVACLLGLSGPVMGQAPVVVEPRPIPPSLTGELGASDVARAVAMIRDLGTTFALLGKLEGETAARDRWAIYQRTYLDAANRLDAMLADGQITFQDLAGAQSAVLAGDGIVLDLTLAGSWQPDAVRTNRRKGASDWADISRLAGVLIAQQTLANVAGGWDEWSAAHGRASGVEDLAGEAPGQSMRPLLARFWHIQDKYLANALAGDTTETGRVAALSNEMLAVLKQVEIIGGWRWRKPLETVWDERDDQARAIAARAIVAPEPVATEVAEPSPPAPPAPAEPPRSADFDTLFVEPEPAPLVTAAGPLEDIGARADIDALYRENSARVQDSQDLGARFSDLSGQVEALAATIAEQGRQLATLSEEIGATRTIPAALAALTASQSALERRLADLGRDVGPSGLSGQLAALRTAMDSAQSRSRDAEQRLEGQVQDRFRTLGREVEAARRQTRELQSGLSAIQSSAAAVPSAAAIEVPLQDAAVRQTALQQAVILGIALLILLLAAIAFWVQAARERANEAVLADDDAMDRDTMDQDGPEPADAEGLAILMAGLHTADQNALRDELTQLREDIESERARAGDLDQRLSRVSAQLDGSQARTKRLTAELAAVRADTRTVGQGLLDRAGRDAAMGDELTGLRQAIEAERDRAHSLQALVDELRSSAVAAKALSESNGEDTPETASHHETARHPETTSHSETTSHRAGPPVVVDLAERRAERRRAIEALHRGDLPGFEQAFAQLTALPPSSVERIVRHSSGQDLALVCRAVGVAKPHLAAILILSRRARPGAQAGDRHLAPRQLAEAMSAFDELSAEAAEQALQGWRVESQ